MKEEKNYYNFCKRFLSFVNKYEESENVLFWGILIVV